MDDKKNQKNKNKFFASILFSTFFKVTIGILIVSPTFFFISLLFKLIFYLSTKDMAMVDEVTDLIFKFGTPYVLAILYIINGGVTSKKK